MFLGSATAPFTLCIYNPAQMFPPFRIPNPFSSFPSFLWERKSGTCDSKIFRHTENIWKLDSEMLSPAALELLCESPLLQLLFYLCPWRAAPSESLVNSIGGRIIIETFAHPFGPFIELSKGLEEVQENVVTGEFLVCVMPGCGSIPRPEAAVAPNVGNVHPCPALLHFPTQLWG